MDKKTVTKILKDTESGYDAMAEKFSETRKFFWREFDFIKNYVNDGDRVLDFGCGNGRLLELINKKSTEYYGVDVSGRLISIAQKKYAGEHINFQKILGSESIPFESNFFNAIYSIAVFHHIPDRSLRKKVATEIYRVMAPGGMLFVTTWNIWQKKYYSRILKNWTAKLIGKSQLEWDDCYIEFKDNQGNIFNRYHHVFSVEEMKNLFKTAGFEVRECKVYNRRNIILVAKKV